MNLKSVLLFSTQLLLFIITSCDSKKEHIRLKDVIEYAEAIPFDSLSKKQQEKIDYCYYYPYNNWRDTEEFDKKESYFVRARIKNKFLAELSKSSAFPVSTLLDDSNPRFLYGKYSNSWKFYDKNNISIRPTTKFGGHDIQEVTRIGDLDNILIGPLPKKPDLMEIEILSDDYEYARNPEYKIKNNNR